ELVNPRHEARVWFIERILDKSLIRVHPQYYLEQLFRRATLMIIGIKFINGAVLFGVCSLYEGESYDVRLLAMAVTLSGTANMTLAYRMITFEHQNIGWIKNLPLSLTRR